MKFQKIIQISDKDVIEEINDSFTNEQCLNFILKILPTNHWGAGFDSEFLMVLINKLSERMNRTMKGTEYEKEWKNISKTISNFHEKLTNDGFYY